MVAIGQAIGSEFSDAWIEAMTETSMQKEFLRMATDKAKTTLKTGLNNTHMPTG